MIASGLKGPNPQQAHAERFSTMLEAAKFIPAINEANLGASALAAEGKEDGASRLHAQSHLLTAIHRIAEDMGYEW